MKFLKLEQKTNVRRVLRNWFCLLLVLLALFTIGSSVANAATDGFNEPFLTGRQKVIDGLGGYYPNIDEYPYNGYGLNSVGFDSLYGEARAFTEYLGEIPYIRREQFNLRYYNGVALGNQQRPFAVYDEAILSIDSTSKDPHLWAMTQSSDTFGNFFGYIGLAIFRGLHWLTSFVLNLIIQIKYIDLTTVTSLLDGSSPGSFAKLLSKLFLIDVDTGALSPFMAFSIMMFLVGLIGLAFRAIRGNDTVKNVVQEIGILLIAFLISGMFMTPTNPSKLSTIGIDFMTSLSNSLVTSALGDSGMVYIYSKSGSTNQNNVKTQQAMINKIYIDSIIEAQFGYPVTELYLTDGAGCTSGFGTAEQVRNAMVATFNGGNEYSMRVVTSRVGTTNSINNLGYYWWAANSSTAVTNNPSSKNIFNYVDGKWGPDMDTHDRTLFVIDFLANLRSQNEGNTALVNKIDKITYNMVHPNYGTAIGKVFFACLENGVLCYALLQVWVFCVLGQVIIILGSFGMVIMPPMLLFKGTRDIAKRLVWTYVLGFLRFLIGNAIFNAIIVITVLLSSSGIGGMVVSVFVVLLLAKFAPQILAEINNYISRTVGRNEMQFVNRAFSRAGHRGRGKNRANKGRRGFRNMFRRGPASGANRGTQGGIDQNRPEQPALPSQDGSRTGIPEGTGRGGQSWGEASEKWDKGKNGRSGGSETPEVDNEGKDKQLPGSNSPKGDEQSHESTADNVHENEEKMEDGESGEGEAAMVIVDENTADNEEDTLKHTEVKNSDKNDDSGKNAPEKVHKSNDGIKTDEKPLMKSGEKSLEKSNSGKK